MYTSVTQFSLARNTQGFTLIEILVSIAVLVVIVAATMGSFTDFAVRQEYRSEVNEITRSLAEQRSKALSSTNNLGHGMYFSSSSVTLFEGASYDSATVSNEVIELDTVAVSFSLSNATSSVSFVRLTATSTATGTIYMTNARLGATSTITIYESGVLETSS